MTDFQFRLWMYLITYVDDYGRGSADPELLKGFVFPRRKGVTEATIDKALQDLANSGSILLYDVDGESYFCFPNWAEHQRIQCKKSKFPAPEDGVIKKSTVSHGESPPESNPIQSESKSESEYKSESKPAHARGSRFEEFWKAYPRNEGKQKARAAFEKVDVDLEVLLEALEQHKRSAQWTKNGGEFIPHASTWLNGRRWEDQMVMNYSAVPKGASGQLGEAELEAIRMALAQPIGGAFDA
jgi:hypothetical protein